MLVFGSHCYGVWYLFNMCSLFFMLMIFVPSLSLLFHCSVTIGVKLVVVAICFSAHVLLFLMSLCITICFLGWQ